MRILKTTSSRIVLAAVLAALLAPGAARAEERIPEGRTIVGLQAHPEKIAITYRFGYAQVLLTAMLDSGDSADVTRVATLVSAPDVVSVSETRLVRPLADGEGALEFEIAGKKLSIPVEVSGQNDEYRVSYMRDVGPVLSRMGCNAGTCHGSQKGQNGFKLSLRGYDPLFDHRALTDDLKGRRFNRADPDKSLFLMKLTGKAPHVGGVLTTVDAPYYRILRSWVAGGVELDLGTSPRVQSVKVVPGNAVLPLPGMKQQLAIYATYTDGTVRDVTAEAFIESSNTEVAVVDKNKIITAVRRGEAAALARFEGRYAATPFFVMGDRSGFEWKDAPTHNYIDELVYAKLRKIKSLPSDICTDEEFLRRVYLDLTGLPPSSQDVRIWLADSRPTQQKRDELIDRLIGSSEFVEHWTNKWSDLLQVNSKFLGKGGATALRGWIRDSVASNKAYDTFVREILDSSGSTVKNPPAAYYKILREPDLVMENTTQLFLGIRFNCNKCHDHPFERWTQDNHWELAAFFGQVGRKDAPGSRKMPRQSATQTEIPAFEEIIFDQEKGDVKKPSTGLVVAPSFPYEHAGGVETAKTRRAMLADWLASKENPYFAKSFVNRLWSYFLGVGFIEPVDDIRAGNPPTNPELLDRLTKDFIDSGFDVRRMMRLICRSRTYQHSIRTNEWNADDDVNFSHAFARRLGAETLFDAVHKATGSVARLPGRRAGSRAAELLDPSTKLPDGFLDIFGRPARESSCECERSSGMSLGQALTLVNGPTVSNAVTDPNNAIADLLAVENDPRKIVDELYLSILSRFPDKIERDEMVRAMDPRNIANAEALTPENSAELTKRYEAFEKSQHVVTWKTLTTGINQSAGGATLASEADGSVLVTGEYPEKDTYTLVALTNLKGITGLRLEALPDERLKAKDENGKPKGEGGPGRPENGNFVLTEIKVTASSAADPTKTQAVTLQSPTASFTQKDFNIAQAIDGKIDDKGWAISPQSGKRQAAVFEAKEDFGFDGGTLLTFRLEQSFPKHSLGKFRLSLTTSKRPIRIQTLPDDIVKALLTPKEKRSDEQKAALFRFYIDRDQDMAQRMKLNAAQDIAWALLNNPAFLFNR